MATTKPENSIPRFKPGPWDDEPDFLLWDDEVTGYTCAVVRNPSMGHLCGYVGIPNGHPCFGMDYEDVYGLVPSLSVHGGVTYSDDHCPGGNETPMGLWWMGFDCAHSGDLIPGNSRFGGIFKHDAYRDFEYVKAECALFAGTLREAATK